MTAPQPILNIAQVDHSYGSVAVLHDINLQLQQGEIVCLLGPSGCGKTTLLRCIAGLEPLRGGQISLAGEVVSSTSRTRPPEKRGVGMVFQDFALFPHRNVRDNVSFGLRSLRGAALTARVQETLQRVRAEKLINAWPHELSGGQQQRVALARALAPQPRVMLMDEPFSGLDATLRRSLRDDARLLLKEVGIATVLVTHDGEEALQMADRIVLMNEGRIILDGDPETVWRRPVDVFSATFFGDCCTTTGIVAAGVVPVGPLRVPAGDVPSGSEVDVVIRHTGLRLRPATAASEHPGTVIDERFLGGRRQSVVEIRHRGQRLLLTARHDNDQHYRPQDRVELSLNPGGAFAFPRS